MQVRKCKLVDTFRDLVVDAGREGRAGDQRLAGGRLRADGKQRSSNLHDLIDGIFLIGQGVVLCFLIYFMETEWRIIRRSWSNHCVAGSWQSATPPRSGCGNDGSLVLVICIDCRFGISPNSIH